MVGLIVYGSLSSSPFTQEISMGDKSQHFVAYFVTMGWFAQLYPNSGRLFAQGVFLVVLAVVLESIQLANVNRVYEFFDIVASAIGVLLGFVVPKTLLHRVLLKTGFAAPRETT